MLLCGLSVGDKFSLGGTTTLLGLGMTFVVLALLIGFIVLINVILKLIEEKLVGKSFFKKDKEKQSGDSVVATEETASSSALEIDGETMIAIRSAVETYSRESDKDGKPHENITILSVKELQ